MMEKQMVFTFDINKCSGCLACIVACRDQNDAKAAGAAFRTVTTRESFSDDSFVLNFISLACMHCGDAPCLMVCPAGAIYRDETTNAVTVKRDLCVGCHSCELACPFGAPKFADDGKMAKCDFCFVRQAYGLKPACVHTCTTGALDFGQLMEISTTKARQAGLIILNSTDLL